MIVTAGSTWKTDETSARRFSGDVTLHQLALSREGLLRNVHYMCVRLADGGSDGMAYESQQAAADACRNSPSRVALWKVPLEAFPPRVADTMLWWLRCQFDAGNLRDPREGLARPPATSQLFLGELQRRIRN